MSTPNTVSGLFIQSDKNVKSTIESYNGLARPGQLIVDTTNYNLYVSDASGNLSPVGGTQISADLVTDLGPTNQNGKIVQLPNTGPFNIYVPNNDVIPLPIGYMVTFITTTQNLNIYPRGVGITTIYYTNSATNAPGSIVDGNYNGDGIPDWIVIPAWTFMTLVKIDTDTWTTNGVGLTENWC